MLTAALVWAILLILYAAKWVAVREAAQREIEDPIPCCFVGLVGVATSLIALVALAYSRPAAVALFVAGALLTLGFAVWRTGGLWRDGRDHGATTPVLYLPTVAGTFVTAIAASALGYPDWGQRLMPWIARQPFAPSYWTFSFGATALAGAALRMGERGDTGAVALPAVPLFVAANSVIAVLTVGTVRLVVSGRLPPSPTPAAPLAERPTLVLKRS